MKQDIIIIYTDGACSGNPGKGGWGAILLYKNRRKNLSKAYRLTTNNRMELMAVIEALKNIEDKSIPVVLYSDSKYVVESINKGYIYNWMSKQFKDVKNPDLWQELIALIKEFKDIKFVWVKGHHHHELNNQCDKMAVHAYSSEINPQNLAIDEFYEKEMKKKKDSDSAS